MFACVGLDLSMVGDTVEQVQRADVRGHDDDGVAEVHRPTLRVGQAAVVENLQQRVEHVGVGLLDLIEEHYRVRLAADSLGQLSALVVADVAGRCSHEPADRVPLLVLTHVKANHVLLGIEERVGQGPGELRLADAGGTQEDERTDGSARVLDAGAGSHDRIGDELDRLVLADDPLMQLLVEVEKLLPLAL